MTSGQEWKQRIVDMVRIKQAIADLDRQGIWEYRLPAVAATEEELKAVEQNLGEELDPEYREFLAYAGGWPAFLQTIDLFGPNDLLGSERFRHAQEMLGYVEPKIIEALDVKREHMLPIAASPVNLDLFVITRRAALKPGEVIWLAGYEIDRFPDFDEYFLAMMDYNRGEVDALQKSRR